MYIVYMCICNMYMYNVCIYIYIYNVAVAFGFWSLGYSSGTRISSMETDE